MKTYNNLSVCLFVWLVAVCSMACSYPATEIKTSVNHDGSIDKSIQIKSKSSSPFQYEQVLNGAGYRLTSDFKIDSSGGYFTFRKHFNNVAELQADLLPASDSTTGIEVKLRKRFRWFYTYYTYTETYKAHPLFDGLPIDRFIKPEDLQYLRQQDTCKQTRDSVERVVRKGFDLLFSQAVDRMIGKGMSAYPDSILLRKKAPSLVHCLAEALPEFSVDDSKQLSSQLDTFILKHYTGAPPIALKPYLMSRLHGWNRVVDLFMRVSMSENKNIVEMPGTIDTTNATNDDFLTTSWTISFYDRLSDYEMYTESREINTLLYVSSVVVFFLLLLYASWRFVLFVQRH